MHITHNHQFLHKHTKKFISNRQANQEVLFWKISVISLIIIRTININKPTLWQNAKSFTATAGGTCSYYWTLKR